MNDRSSLLLEVADWLDSFEPHGDSFVRPTDDDAAWVAGHINVKRPDGGRANFRRFAGY